MQQRFDIAKNENTNRLSIREFAVTEKKYYKRDSYEPVRKDYAFIYEVSYDSDMISVAIKEGQKALISALRTPDFFPTYPCAEMIAEKVTVIYDGGLQSHFEVFFDDRDILPDTDKD